MPKLPTIKAKVFLKILLRQGYVLDHIQGSHHIMRNASGLKTSIPIHGNLEIPKGTLLAILKNLNISKDELMVILKK